ncbi:polysaccharide pyruvyl transferase family protein [Lederbergia panacisoli]|uniref:polysaccharide pyruvyl transferase family protein n=1 Tax=Lederbergia panacisoli TaxID=1255251 RepID=UPI00214AC274|nr:polysaccharide pyruvyl transferase family protein [Lederbergia panacisoli]MCR2823824.1 polysaccharide pyruvyl transferase family protein [Lederbergia panacisoli]
MKKKVWNRVRKYIDNKVFYKKLENNLIKDNGKKCFVFGAPYHSNMGDQAQTYCIIKWVNRNYKDHSVYCFDTKAISGNNYKAMKLIKRHIKSNDKLFLHSGYHTTDLYMLEENMQRETVKQFIDQHIVVLPQTIYYKDPEEEKKAIQIYNSHPNLTFMCRDDISYDTAKRIFSNCNLIKFPDVVTTLIGTKQYFNERNGILLCMRNDKEALYSKSEVSDLVSHLGHLDKTEITDTTINKDAKYISNNREATINSILEEYSKYKVIITDRYHGTIFSLITNTPVIVLSSTDHKLSSGVKWFPQEFRDYVFHVKDIKDVKSYVEKIYSMEYEYKLEPYFNQNFYDKLKDILE